MADPQEDVKQQDPTKKDKRDVVEKTDAEGAVHVSDDAAGAGDQAAPLVEDVSADVAPVVSEFMDQAAQQNEAAAEAVPDVKNKPGSYISFEHVYKSFDDFVVLEDVSFCVLPGETLCILGRSGVGKSVSLQMLMGFLKPDSGIIRVAGENISGYSERADAGDSAEGDDGLPEWGAVRLDFGGGECGFSAAGAWGSGGRPDSAGGEGAARDGGGGGDGRRAVRLIFRPG